MVMSKNDERIIQLKKQIEIKKDELGKATRFSPITNCSLELDGTRYNIQVLQKQELTHLLVKLTSYKLAFGKLDIDEDYTISGYNVADWIEDISSKLEVIKFKNKENQLKDMESKLSKMLSDEKKTELELDEIASMLK